jgi:hypothetical protein
MKGCSTMKTEISIEPSGGKRLNQLLALFVAIALTPSMLLAQAGNQLKGRDKAHDPTGAWFLRTSLDIATTQAVFALIVFHQGGTVTGNIQGESAFDPSAVPAPPGTENYNNNVISTPSSGVWQKTRSNTFAATLMDIEYHVSTNPEPGVPVAQFTIQQYSGKITGGGDTMELTGRFTHYDEQGNLTFSHPVNASGVRIPLTILPNSIDKLPIPPEPPQ